MSDLTAAQMAGMDVCTPQCLVSTGTEATACSCACQGRWHGSLASITVPGTADARPAPPEPHPGQEDILAHLAADTGTQDIPAATAARTRGDHDA